jgi:hypothetical protein
MRRGARVALVLLAAACSNLNELADGVIALEVIPPNPSTIEFGDTARYVVRALDQNGDSVAADVRWVTPDTTLDIIDPIAGLVTGKYPDEPGRMQAQLDNLKTGFFTLTVEPRADTLIVPGPVEDTVTVDETASVPLVARIESFNPAGPLIYEIVDPVFADTAQRTVQLSSGALADTVTTATDGTPAEVVAVVRREGATPPASVTVQVRSVQRRGTPVPGSGQAFTVRFF